VKICLQNNSVVINAAAGEPILPACARAGIVLSAPCGGRRHCGKCKVLLLDGQIAGDKQDAAGFVRACAAVPLSDITIALPEESGASLTRHPADSTEHHASPARHTAGAFDAVNCSAEPIAIGTAAIALDIGTTTVAARLVDLDTSRVIDTVSQLNDQRVFGADVMSRINAAQKGKTAELFALINRQTKRILAFFQDQWNIHTFKKLAVSGNTTMLHLFLNVDPSGLGTLPFTPVFLEERTLSGEELSLPVESVTVLPSIAAFIGGDITAGLAVLDILNVPGPSLFIDIGTNGEMALANQRTIFCCSTAAGPAFEGAEISCGMGGVEGAISAVELAPDEAAAVDAAEPGESVAAAAAKVNALSLTTIGNVTPTGVCGSGLIDAVALMLKQNIIDESGYMENPEKGFCLAPGVSISGRDIRQFQLAKSAILSGIRILCKNAGVDMADIQNVFIAGGFGFFINKRNAVAAGLFPPEFLDALCVCGNVSLQGAVEFLTGKDFPERCKKTIAQCTVIDLAADSSFMDLFAENMLFTKN